MGREIKRVPLDFNWPLNEVWKGFKNPHYVAKQCTACEGMGYSPYALHLHKMWYGDVDFDPSETGSKPFSPKHPIVLKLARRNVEACTKNGYYIGTVEDEAKRLCRQCFNNHWCHHLSQEDVNALIAEDRLMDFTHNYDKNQKPGFSRFIRKDPMPVVTAEMINEWSLAGMGHDSCNSGICIKARCEKAGKEYYCPECKGHGHIWPSPEAEKLYDEWKEENPPQGEGYQLWETVSDGSPITPVFATPEELANWLVMNDKTITKDMSYEEWVKFIKGPGWACSMVGVGPDMTSGVKYFANQD